MSFLTIRVLQHSQRDRDAFRAVGYVASNLDGGVVGSRCQAVGEDSRVKIEAEVCATGFAQCPGSFLQLQLRRPGRRRVVQVYRAKVGNVDEQLGHWRSAHLGWTRDEIEGGGFVATKSQGPPGAR